MNIEQQQEFERNLFNGMLQHNQQTKLILIERHTREWFEEEVLPEIHEEYHRRIVTQQIEFLTDKIKDESTDECAICYEDKKDAIIYPCNHTFHFSCVNHLNNVKSMCPLCRGEIIFLISDDKWVYYDKEEEEEYDCDPQL